MRWPSPAGGRLSGRGMADSAFARLRTAFTQWQARRRSHRRRVARAVWELRERYGAAAPGIARNSARAPVGNEGRRFWRQVARELAAT